MVRHALLGSDVHVTIVRRTLVYGPEVKANFLSLLKLVDSGLPLPLANIRNERSIIFVDNLGDLLAVESGQRELTESWAAVLRDLKPRGLRAPKLTIADGHLGISIALTAVYPTSAEPRCWNHKLRNVLDTVPPPKH